MGLKQRILPYLALGVGIISLSFSALFARWANAPGPVIAFYRISIATLILAPAFLWRRRAATKPVSLGWGILIFPFLGGIFTALDHAFWNTAVNNTTAANATLLGNTAPLWVALGSWLLFHEHLTNLFWVGLAFALGGAAIVLGTDFLYHPAFGWGDVLALLAGVFYACYFLVTQRGRQWLDTLSYVWLVNLTSSLFLLVICVLLGMSLKGYPPQTYLAFIGAALVPQVIGYLAVGYALGHLPISINRR
jgi:drug/metabolite transporter (DMT)-like permease